MDGNDLKLLGTKVSPFSHRVEWGLKLKGIAYQFIEQDLKHKSSILVEANPVYKKVPVLIHGQTPICESLVILEYVDEVWNLQGKPHILPQDPHARAHARFWAKFVDDKLMQASTKAFYSSGEEQKRALASMAEALQLIEGETRHREGKLFGGENIGFLDIALGVVAYWFMFAEEAAGLDIIQASQYPTLFLWIKNFLQFPIIKHNLPPPSELRRICNTLQTTLPSKVQRLSRENGLSAFSVTLYSSGIELWVSPHQISYPIL